MYHRTIGAERESDLVLICDHASNHVPSEINGGSLGLSDEDMSRHIAFDIGAAGVTETLAELLQAPAAFSHFSRLVIDPNRGEDDPTVLMRLYDGSIIPANRHADAHEKARRIEHYHRPYHDVLDALISARKRPVIISVHSFTPQLIGRPPRPWHIGVLYSKDRRMADPLLKRLGREGDLIVGDNEPYSGHLPGDTMDRHAIAKRHPHVLIELRNDLISTPELQTQWATRLAPILRETIAQI